MSSFACACVRACVRACVCVCVCVCVIVKAVAAAAQRRLGCRWLMQLLHNMGHDQSTITSLVAEY